MKDMFKGLTVWKVDLGHEEYSGENREYIIIAKEPGEAWEKAKRIAASDGSGLKKGWYARHIRLLGEVDA